MPQVYYSVLPERTIPEHGFASLMDLAMRSGAQGHARINIGYSRVDVARNTVTKAFLLQSKSDDDTLVMLDCDHVHPDTVVERLARHSEGVVCALAFRRCPPYDPQIYRHGEGGQLVQPSEWGQGLLRVDAFGMAAIAIKRWVFRKLDESGMLFPYFRFWYPKGMGMDNSFPSEDIFFGLACEAAGVECYCDTTVVSPHLTVGTVDETSWTTYLADHPEMRAEDYAPEIPPDLRVKVLGEQPKPPACEHVYAGSGARPDGVMVTICGKCGDQRPLGVAR